MKSMIALLVLTASLTAVAGPEDHRYESCYTATTSTPAAVPTEYCFDDVNLNPEKSLLYTSGTFSNLPETLKVTSLIHITEDRTSFEAQSKIVNVWESGCGNGESAVLSIKGISDIMQGQQINPKELTITVDYSSTNDTCHSRPQAQKIIYKLTK